MIIIASPGHVANPGVLEISSAPRRFLGRGFGVVPKGTVLRPGFWRLVIEFQLLRYLTALVPFPIAMLIWPDLALPISQLITEISDNDGTQVDVVEYKPPPVIDEPPPPEEQQDQEEPGTDGQHYPRLPAEALEGFRVAIHQQREHPLCKEPEGDDDDTGQEAGEDAEQRELGECIRPCQLELEGFELSFEPALARRNFRHDDVGIEQAEALPHMIQGLRLQIRV